MRFINTLFHDIYVNNFSHSTMFRLAFLLDNSQHVSIVIVVYSNSNQINAANEVQFLKWSPQTSIL